MKKRLLFAILLAPLVITGVVIATPQPKYFVCKYVGTPSVNETLQTGQNPISVSGNALPDGTNIGDSFADAQGRSYVIAEDTGQQEPTCPVPENPKKDVCPNIEGDQLEVPEGMIINDKDYCIVPEGQGGDDEPEQPNGNVQGANTTNTTTTSTDNLVPFSGK